MGARDKINDYIKTRYARWLDYASYHCSCAGIADESVDVLNEVLCDLLQKPVEKVSALLEKKSGKYTEADWFIMKMIKLNATSKTSPYRHKYKPLPIDANTDYTRLDIEDISEEDYDRPGEYLDKFKEVCQIADRLDLTPEERAVFHYRFMQGESFKDIQLDKKEIKTWYGKFYDVRSAIRFCKSKVHPPKSAGYRVRTMVKHYLLCKEL